MIFNYTTELRTFFDNYRSSDPRSQLPHREQIELGRPKLFDFEYPLFDPNYKKVFETNFIRNFYMREIGFETFGLFKFQLETWLIINMPYFNKMFESELLKYDPLTNTKVDMNHNKKSDKSQNDVRNVTDNKSLNGESNSESNRIGTSTNKENTSMSGNSENKQTKNETGSGTKDETGSVTDDNFNRELESDNPDSRLAITTNDGQGVIEYAKNIKENSQNNAKTSEVSGKNSSEVSGTNTSNESSSVNGANDGLSTVDDNTKDNTSSNITQNDIKNDSLESSINDIEDFVQHRIGKIGVQSFPKLIQEHRSALLRIEKMIFDEMNELFMLVY